MTNPIPSAAATAPDAQRPRGGFGQIARPRRRMSSAKASAMSPEARRELEDRNRRMIEEAVAEGRVTKCPVRWALGSTVNGTFGAAEA